MESLINGNYVSSAMVRHYYYYTHIYAHVEITEHRHSSMYVSLATIFYNYHNKYFIFQFKIYLKQKNCVKSFQAEMDIASTRYIYGTALHRAIPDFIISTQLTYPK